MTNIKHKKISQKFPPKFVCKVQNLKMLISLNVKGQIHPALIRLDFMRLGVLLEVVGGVYQNSTLLIILVCIHFLYLFFFIWVNFLVCSFVCFFFSLLSLSFECCAFLCVKNVTSVMCVPLYACFLVSFLLLVGANLLVCSQLSFFVYPWW